MAETLTNQTELEEEVEEVDKEIFEDPPGQSSGEKAAVCCIFFFVAIWVLGAIAGQLYLGAAAIIRLEEITSQGQQAINTTTTTNSSDVTPLNGIIGVSFEDGRKAALSNVTGSEVGSNCPQFEDFGMVYPEPEHVLFVFGVCAFALAFPPLNIFWYFYAWIAFSAYIGIEGERLQKDCPGAALDELQYLIFLMSVIAGSLIGSYVLLLLLVMLFDSVYSDAHVQHIPLTPLRLTRPAIRDLEKQPEVLT